MRKSKYYSLYVNHYTLKTYPSKWKETVNVRENNLSNTDE